MLSNGELLLREYLKIKYHWVEHCYNIRPDWLKWKTGNNLELDVYIDDLKIGFEFNGSHHLTDAKQKERDAFKRIKCKENGIEFKTFSLQTLHAYALSHNHNVGKYANWFEKLDNLLKAYRNRYPNDKTISITYLPPPPPPKNSGRGFIKGIKTKKLSRNISWTKKGIECQKNRSKNYFIEQEAETSANKARIIHKLFY